MKERCDNPAPACLLLDQLSLCQEYYLKMWDADCSAYLLCLREPRMGALKAEDDLFSRAKSCSRDEFDKYVGDFDAEMTAVRELSRIGFREFESILTRPDVKTVDYRARLNSDDVCVEVKNIRAPITILDVFASGIRARHREEPSRAGKKAPFAENLELDGGIAVTVRIENGSGQAAMTRGEGFEKRGETSLPGFLNKVDFHTRKAMLQFANEPNRAHVLVLNINTPAGSIWSDFLNAAERVADLSGGTIRCEFLLHGHRIAPDNV